MKKKILIISIIVLFVCIGQVHATNEVGDKIIIDTTSWTDVLVMIISFVNLIFIVGFYINDQKNRKSDQKIDYKFFWYKDYVLKDAIKIIEEHMDNCKNIIDDCKQYKSLSPSIEEYSTYLTEITIWKFNESNNNTKKRISELLKTIDGDISNDIIEEFRNIQDIFTEKIQNVNEDIDSLYGEIVEKKPKLMNTLYKYGLEILK